MSRRPRITKAQIEKALNVAIPDRHWRYLEEGHWISEAAGEDNPAQFLEKEIRQLLDLSNVDNVSEFIPKRRQRRQKSLPIRHDVISQVVADIARGRSEVQSFRAEVLAGRLLTLDDVPDWVERHREVTDHLHAVIVKIPKDPRCTGEGGDRTAPSVSDLADRHIEGYAPVEMVEYVAPGAKSVTRRPVGRDGPLRRLKEIASTLSRLFRWQEALATTFVLTDITPMLVFVGADIGWPPHTRVREGPLLPVACLTRVNLVVDLNTTPRELAEVYGRLRAKLLKQKPRQLSEKHLQLAGLYSRTKALSAEHIERWNEEHPEWCYRRFSLFSRDAKAAFERIVYELPFEYRDFWKPVTELLDSRQSTGSDAGSNSAPEQSGDPTL